MTSADDRGVELVTGAGSGIGRATALRLLADGYRVALGGRREATLRETARLAEPARSVICLCDVTEAKAVANLVATTVDTFGRSTSS